MDDERAPKPLASATQQVANRTWIPSATARGGYASPLEFITDALKRHIKWVGGLYDRHDFLQESRGASLDLSNPG